MNETDLMPYGEHKGTAVAHVPSSALLELWESPETGRGLWEEQGAPLTYPNRHRVAVRDYIIANFAALAAAAPSRTVSHPPTP